MSKRKRRRRKKKRKRRELPHKLIIFKNPDKEFHEKWYKGRSPLNIVHPYRCLCLSNPNRGKTNIAKNLILAQEPPFQRVIVIHCDPEYTQEYDDIGVEMMKDIPTPEEFDGIQKTLCILDDLEFKTMRKDQKRALDRLFGFVSTHKNVSCILCSQDCFQVPPIVRRCSNLWILWKLNDMENMARIAKRSGVNKEQFVHLFDKFANDTHDSLWIDRTKNSPFPLRVNGYDIIDKKKKKKEKKEKVIKRRTIEM